MRYYDFYASYTYQILVGGSYKTGQSVRIAGKEKKDGIGGRLTERHVWEHAQTIAVDNIQYSAALVGVQFLLLTALGDLVIQVLSAGRQAGMEL